MITKQQIEKLQKELLQQKEEYAITGEEASLRDENSRESIGELSLYDNHPADIGTELFERGKDLALSEHAQIQLDKVDHALNAINEGTYGICEHCGAEIPYERLEAIPFTTFCTDHSPEQNISRNRPVEERILLPADDDTFAVRRETPNQHFEDSFEEVAKYGTSETPSDFLGDYDDYNELYQDESKDGTQEEYENFSVTDISGKHRETIQSDEQVEYKEMLDDTGMESPLGDIPYKEGDSYLEDEKS